MVFDFTKFSINAIKVIDEIRGTNSNPNNTVGAVEKTESRINAFYRALGLPAFVNEDNQRNLAFKHNNGNVFEDSGVSEVNKDKIQSRQIAFTRDIPEDKVKSFMDYNKFNIDDGIEIDKVNAKRIRGSLNPMFVDGNILIYPQSNRVAGAFHAKDYLIDDVKYKRPLIELITLLRFRGKGVYDSEINKAVQKDFSSTIPSLLGSIDFNLITSQIVSNLLLSVLEIPDFVNKTTQEINKTRTKTRKSFESLIANIPSEQPIESKSSLDGSIDKLKSKQEEIIDRNHALISLLEFDDTITGGEEITRNMKEALLSSSVLNMIEIPTEDINKKISDTQDKEKKFLKILKNLQQKMDIVLGIYCGISGIDILLTITALFIIEEKYLLGLLNSETQDNLSALKNKIDLKEVASVSESIVALEATLSDLFRLVTQKMKRGDG